MGRIIKDAAHFRFSADAARPLLNPKGQKSAE
jgi:hypothetical protein